MDPAALLLLKKDLDAHPCIWCGTNNYTIEDGLPQIVLQSHAGMASVLVIAVITCMKCGLQYLFNTKVRQLVPADSQPQLLSGPTAPPVLQASPQTVEDALQKSEEQIKKETAKLYAVENRAGILMGVVATIITILFVVPNENASIGYLNLTLLAPLLPLLASFLFYMFTFMPSLHVNTVVTQVGSSSPTPPNQPPIINLGSFAPLKTALDKTGERKTFRIRWAHSFMAAGLITLVISQIFVRYTAEWLTKQSALNYILEFALLLSVQVIIALVVRSQFKNKFISNTPA